MQTMTESYTPNCLILIVDDEQSILNSLSRLLEDEDYSVMTANCGADGLAILDRHKVDLIISDMRMPNMDGASFLKQAAEKRPDSVRILLTGFADMKSTIAAVNEGRIFQYIAKPWNDEDLLRRVRDALEMKQLRDYNQHLERIQAEQNARLLELTEQQETIIKQRTAELEQTASQLDTAYKELQETYYQTVPLLANLIELNERHKKQHSVRVAKVAELIAKAMPLSDQEARQTYFGAVLHDIGKIGIEPAILGKSVLEMTPIELKRYQQHAQLGEAALLSFDPLRQAAQIILHHHERFDGKGFPGKLGGHDIPIGARIVAVANDYDNLQMPINFLGKVLSETQAHDYILSESGKRYDPAVVRVFCGIIDQIRALVSQNKEVILTTDKVQPGMKLSRDLVNQNGMVMLAAGKLLTEIYITKLKQFEVTFNTKLQIAIKHAGN